MGFAGSVNRALDHCGTCDAVVLNSDIVVHGSWLKRLHDAAYSAADIGTVTPLTDDGTVVSYPAAGMQDCDAALLARLDAVTAIVNAGVAIDLPVGIGFCLYIRDDCLSDTGALDAATFGKGYGEETDFCLRARALAGGTYWRPMCSCIILEAAHLALGAMRCSNAAPASLICAIRAMTHSLRSSLPRSCRAGPPPH